MPKIMIVTLAKLELTPFVQMAVDDKIVLVWAETIEQGYDAFQFYNDNLVAIVISTFALVLRPYTRALAATIKRLGYQGQLINCDSICEALPVIEALVTSQQPAPSI